MSDKKPKIDPDRVVYDGHSYRLTDKAVDEALEKIKAERAQPPTPKASEGADVTVNLTSKDVQERWAALDASEFNKAIENLRSAIYRALPPDESHVAIEDAALAVVNNWTLIRKAESLSSRLADESELIRTIQLTAAQLSCAYHERREGLFTNTFHASDCLACKMRSLADRLANRKAPSGDRKGVTITEADFERLWEWCRDYSTDYSDMKRLMKQELFCEWTLSDEPKRDARRVNVTVGDESADSPEALKDAFLEAIQKLDGIAAVNLEEPSPGDLKRINDAYHAVLKENAELKHRLQKELDKNAGEVKGRNEALARARKAESALESLKGNPK